MKTWITLSFSIWISTLALAAEVAPNHLRDVSPDDVQALKKQIPALWDSHPSLSAFDEGIRVLLKTGHYENIFVEQDKDQLVLIAKPLRLVDSIQIHGADQISESELRNLMELKPGERFDRKKAVTSGEKIKRYYGERGFFNAVVEIDFQIAESKNMVVDFKITENSPCKIAGIDFQTANTDLKASLESQFRRLINRDMTDERMDRFLRNLNKFLIENGYLAVDLSPPDVRYNKDKTKALIQIEMKEPYRWETYYSGFQEPRNEGKMRSVADFGNLERKNVEPAGEGAERLRRYYVSEGYPNVKVSTGIKNPKGTYLKRVYYDIDEGERVKIKKVDIQGRVSRGAGFYEKFILNNSSPKVEKRIFVRADLENGFKNLVTALRNQGFLRAKILSSRVEYNEARNEVVVEVFIDEGPQTQIRALDFEGNRFFSSYELAQVTGLQTNEPLRLSEFEASIEKLKSFYRNQGFLEMKLLNEGEELISYNDSGSQARITFRLFEGPRIRIHSIVVEGNTFTKSRVILKEADFHIGEVLTPQKLDDATARLNKLGLFSRADVRTLEEGTNVAERTLVVNVTERDPGVFRFGAGVNNERNLTVRGFTGLSYNNLWGTGRGISGRVEVKSNVAQINYLENEVAAGYFEPFLLETRTRGRVNLSRSERVFYDDRPTDVTLITVSNRIDFVTERDLTQHTKFTWKLWSLDSRREFERNSKCTPPDCDNIDQNGGKFPAAVQQVSLVGPSLDIDYRDNPFLPTRGSFTHLAVDYSHPEIGSSDKIEFVRSEGNYTYYQRLGSPNWVWANSLRGGYLSNLNTKFASGVPTSHSFFLGGINTIRGFDLADTTERLPADGNDGFKAGSQTKLLIKSDSHYYLFKSELRFPIYGDHGGVLFYDGGEVKVSGYRFARPYRDSVGIGYRYNTPVGPLSADVAFKIHPRPGEKDFRFHLSIGTF